MRLVLINREKLQSLGSALVGEFDNLVARIRGGWNAEHNEDGSHSNITADSIQSGRVVYTGIVTETIGAARVDDFNPTIQLASVLRIDPLVDGALITGLHVPQDETGKILDGRVLLVENITATGKALRFASDQTALGQVSAARNRFELPRQPGATNANMEFVLHPASFVTLMYNAVKSRWIIASQHLDQSEFFYSFAVSQGEILMGNNMRPIRTWRFSATAPDLYVSGFDSLPVPDDEIKTVVNDGTWAFTILHANSSIPAKARVYCPGQVRYLLHPRESIQVQKRREGGWRILSKADQWIDVPFVASNFNIPMTAVNQFTFCYQVDGNKMTIAFNLVNLTLSAATPEITIRIPDDRVSARDIRSAIGQAVDNGTPAPSAFVRSVAGGTTIVLYADANGTAWKASAGLSRMAGVFSFMLTEHYGMMEPHTDVIHADASHGDADHADVPHIDTAHVDSHSDTAHGDGGHADLSHTDLHTDGIHVDTHSDTGHVDSHSDVAHADVPHGDVGHLDEAHQDSHGDGGHTDTHSDWHVDQHGDVPAHSDGHGDLHYDWHYDEPPAWSHDDYHEDYGSQWPHTDTHTDEAHQDSHGDVPHADQPHGDEAHEDAPSSYVPHSDVPHTDQHSDVGHDDTHADTPHTDSHSDTPHTDGAHSDAAHADGHTDTPHSDGLHTDQSHVDNPHGDTTHQDQGFHIDTGHTDI